MNTHKQTLPLLLVAFAIAMAAAPAYCGQGGGGNSGSVGTGGTSSTGGSKGGGNGGGGGGTTTPTVPAPTGDPYVSQTGSIGSNNGFILDVNGSPANTDGHDHVYVPGVGVTYNYLPALPTGTDITYRTVTVASTTTYIQQKTAADGTKTDSGPRYEQQTVAGTPKYVPIVPGAGVSQITLGQLDGTLTNTTLTGIIASGLHSGDQVAGGITNGIPQKSASIEALIDAVKKSADTFIDISKSQNFTGPDPSKFGDPDTGNYKFVYARGSKNSDGTINEEPDASGMGGLKFAGGFKGAGILVVEVEDPDNAQLEFAGSSMWVGLVIVVSNKNPTKNNAAPLVTVGGGTSIHLVGGAFVYMRNQEDSLLGQNFTKLAGQADIKYSSQALNFLTESRPTSMEVRSWAKLGEE